MTEEYPRVYSTKRHGTTLRTCDSEPVQTPGCVQAHGVLLILRTTDLVVLQVTENSEAVLGLSPNAILNKPFEATFGEGCADHIKHALVHEKLERNPLCLTTVEPDNVTDVFDMIVHTLNGVVYVELEPVIRDGAAILDYYTLVKRTTARLQIAPSLREYCQIITEEIRRITKLDRVMVYRFLPDDTGEVFAEDKRDDLPGWLGFRYPPHDVPKPAREIFKKIWIRPVPDATGELAELVPLANPETGQSIEMTYCALRGASVMYTEYLQNMGVAASLTLSILCEGELWGLIACHHHTPKRFPHQMRTAAELVAQFASLQLTQAEEREDVSYHMRLDAINHAVLARAAKESRLSALLEGSPSILDGIEATGVALYHGDTWHKAGQTPNENDLDALAKWLRETSRIGIDARTVYATDRLSSEFPQAAEYKDIGSGLLATAVSRSRQNLILWFRPEVEQTVHWGGNPHESPAVVGPHGPRLTPRKSFELWQELVRGCSNPWKSVEIEAAKKFRLLVMDLVISRAEQLAEMNAALRRSNDELDAFAHIAGHDLKEPLRGINQHAQLLLEDARAGRSFDKHAEERIEAVLKLTVRMDSLINALLQFSRFGNEQPEIELVDLRPVVKEAIEMLGALVVGNDVEILIPRPMPMVQGAWIKLREVFANLIGNAIKYNDRAKKVVEIGYFDSAEIPLELSQSPNWPNAVFEKRVFYVRDNGIGIDSRYFNHVFKIFKRIHMRDAYGGGSGAGLAIVKKIVEQHGGVVWIQSTLGVGSTFYFTIEEKERNEA